MNGAVSGAVTLRGWRESDWDAFEPVFREVVADGRTYAIDASVDDADAQAFWSDCAHRVVAEVDGELLGAAKMGPNRPAQGAHVGTASFMVGSAARGKGVGRALGEYVVDWHRREGFRAIQFNAVVSTNRAAVALWRSLGFEVVGTVPEAFGLPDGSWADLLVMHLDLTRTEELAEAAGADDGRVAVIEAAVEVFERRGWSGTTMERVATRAGVPAAEVTRRFGSKADLLMVAMRHTSLGGEYLSDAFAALSVEDSVDVDDRLLRVARFVHGIVSRVSPLVRVLWEAADEDPVAAALRQGTELRRLALSRTIAELVRRGESVSPDAVGGVQTLCTAENYLCLTALGWSGERYAAWLAGALDHAVNGAAAAR